MVILCIKLRKLFKKLVLAFGSLPSNNTGAVALVIFIYFVIIFSSQI